MAEVDWDVMGRVDAGAGHVYGPESDVVVVVVVVVAAVACRWVSPAGREVQLPCCWP